MLITDIEFGNISIDGKAYEQDFVVSKGEIEIRDKENSRKLKEQYGGHTPLTPQENIPWDCKNLIIGNGFYGSMPVSPEFQEEADKRGIQVIIMDTPTALSLLSTDDGTDTNYIIHIRC